MANSFSDSVRVEIAAVDAVVDAIRAVDVPALAAEHATINAVVDAIRATDITTITNAIAAKLVKVQYEIGSQANQGAAYIDLCNITGAGKLYYLIVVTDGSGAGEIKVSIDGLTSGDLAIGNSQVVYLTPYAGQTYGFNFEFTATITSVDLDFDSNLRVQCRNSAVNFTAHCWYGVQT